MSSEGGTAKHRIHLAIPSWAEEGKLGVQRLQPQCEWHWVTLSSSASLSLSLSFPHLPDRTAAGPERTLYEASAFLSWPYLMIDGFMATANVPFLNNLCCYRHRRPPYNGSYFYNLLHDQYFKRLRGSANELLNKVSGGFETIIASVLTTEWNREIKKNTSIYIRIWI